MFKAYTSWLQLNFCASPQQTLESLMLTSSGGGWRGRAQFQSLMPGFPVEAPTSLPPTEPSQPIPTDVPIPSPMDVPVPEPRDVPVPDPGTEPSPAKPQSPPPKPRSVP